MFTYFVLLEMQVNREGEGERKTRTSADSLLKCSRSQHPRTPSSYLYRVSGAQVIMPAAPGSQNASGETGLKVIVLGLQLTLHDRTGTSRAGA